MKMELWMRLRQYQFDNLVPPHLTDRVLSSFGGADASTRAFASKLARKLGWRTAFALRAIAEYRKFVYLGVVADFNVTPPKVIDQVWHEHLLFSRAYREFCHDVLRREFDHNPELVPVSAETDVYQAQYAATLALYEAEFHAKPPQDIWGHAKFGTRGERPEAVPRRAPDGAFSPGDDTPLYLLFGAGDAGDAGGIDVSPDFGGGGGFSGGGGGSSWGDADAATDSGAESGADTGGGDSGSSDGGSGCSSSCGSSD